MHFTTFIVTTAMIALASAKPAMRQYGNGTTTETPTVTGTGSPNWETMPTFPGSNATVPATSSEVSVITSKIVGSTTLTYTLGPEGSSSVVTTVVESTTTITMTNTAYLTMTAPDSPTATPDSSITDPGVLPSAVESGSELAGTSAPTETVTNYLTVTQTITMESVQTGSSAGPAPNDGSDLSPGSDSGSAIDNSGLGNANPVNGGQNGGCSVTTVTATLVEHSTVTVTPTSTDNLPVLPTATPSYGFGNGTNPTSYPTASSGFLTFYYRSKPTKV